MPLFRPAVAENIIDRTHGSIILYRPLSFTVLTYLFATIAGILLTFMGFCSYSRKVVVPGILLPSRGVIQVVSMQSGIIDDSLVREGQVVKSGDSLFALSNQRFSEAVGDTEREISNKLQLRRDSLVDEQVQLRLQARSRIELSRSQIENAKAEITRIDDELTIQKRRVELTEEALKRFHELAVSGFVSAVQVQGKLADALDQQQKQVELQRSRASAARDLVKSQADARELQLQAIRDAGASDRGIAMIEQELTENEAKRHIVVRSPSAGTVTAITVDPGQAIEPGQAIASLLPTGSRLEAALYAPSRAVGFLKPGMKVSLRYQAYPYQKFGEPEGWVEEISKTALRPEEVARSGLSAVGESLYRIKVRLVCQTVRAYGVEQPLRAGSLLEASIVLDRRKLYEWVFEPLYSISGHLLHDA